MNLPIFSYSGVIILWEYDILEILYISAMTDRIPKQNMLLHTVQGNGCSSA